MSELNNPTDKSKSLSDEIDNELIDSNLSSIKTGDSKPKNNQKTSSKLSKEFLKNVDWYNVACKLRKSNRKLVKRIMELEGSLVDYQDKLETQQRHCETVDNIVQKQTQELNHYQEEISGLYNQLEKACQDLQQQQIFIESLSEQLQTSQQQVAILEKDCSLLQKSCNQQKRQLLEVEKHNRELEIRLQREQHKTLKFKTALDQYFKASSNENTEESPATRELTTSREIKPWSQSQLENRDVSINNNLHKKLLSTQSINADLPSTQNNVEAIGESDVLEKQKTTQNVEISVSPSAKTEEVFTNNQVEDNSFSEPEEFSEPNVQKIELEENILLNKDEPDETNLNINLPSWNKTKLNSSESVPKKKTISLLLETSSNPSKNKKKSLLKLPKFLQ